MKRTLLLFDVDGTLLLTGGAGMRAMRTVAAEMFGPEFTWDGVKVAGGLDPCIFADAVARNGGNGASHCHDQFRDLYLLELPRALSASADAVRALPGVLDLLASLRGRSDVMLGLLTGNYTQAIPIKFDAVGIDPGWFELTALGDEAPTRPDLVALAMRRYASKTGHEPDARRVIVIGDTPRDIACAHAHGCFAVAVSTGPHSVDELRLAGADLVMKDLADPTPLLNLLDQSALSGIA